MDQPTPAEIAANGQHYAMVDHDLTEMIHAYQQAIGDVPRIDHLEHLVNALCCPHLDDGTEMGHEAHISTLAYLAAAAIDRLARGTNVQKAEEI